MYEHLTVARRQNARVAVHRARKDSASLHKKNKEKEERKFKVQISILQNPHRGTPAQVRNRAARIVGAEVDPTRLRVEEAIRDTGRR